MVPVERMGLYVHMRVRWKKKEKNEVKTYQRYDDHPVRTGAAFANSIPVDLAGQRTSRPQRSRENWERKDV